ncbi:MAG: aldo/keto reductase [Candidatus Hydrogenedentota bacterium]
MHEHKIELGRREFMLTSAAAIVAATAVPAFAAGDGLDHRNERPDRMTYRKLGRTNFVSSRLVFGCGGALAGGRAVKLLEQAFEQGINFFDVGSNDYYKQSENYLAPFYKAHRDEIFVSSKAPVRVKTPAPGESLTAEDAQSAAKRWTDLLNQSLKDLDTDHIDAYYIMMIDIPEIVKSEEMRKAFETAKAAGKVDWFGISTHRNAQACLEAAVEAGVYDLAMIAINPAGWYDPFQGGNAKGTQPLNQLRPVLDRASQAGIGLIGMKAGQGLASAKGDNALAAYDQFYSPALMQAALTPFQRSYAYVLENGLDVVNADMQNFKHFEENLIAARTAHTYSA